MTERIYNIFIHFEADICSAVSYKAYDHAGSDDVGIKFLLDRVSSDSLDAKEFKLKASFTRQEYNAKCRLGEGHHLYNDLFVSVNAAPSPLFVVTPMKDGEVFFNYSAEGHGSLDMNDISAKLGASGVMEDWLVKYTNKDGINTSQLIHDDYFLAIKLTFNAGHYVSSMKLLVSCIDSLAYIEYGNVRNPPPFISWLETYADLSTLGITATELWELRNGILHMTNINSDRVRKNKVRRISFRVGRPMEQPSNGANDVYYFYFQGLIEAFSQAQARWIETYNNDRSKFAKFVERYDETISDTRMAFTHLGGRGFEVTT